MEDFESQTLNVTMSFDLLSIHLQKSFKLLLTTPTLKNMFQKPSAFHCLLYNRLPCIMVKILMGESAKKLNFFPAKHGVSKYYSPQMILHQQNLDYNKHCQYAFGTYVQAHDEPDPSNTNSPCTLDCIYLHYNDNEQGGHDLLHLQTNQMITHRKVTPIPITPAIIKQVHRIAELEGMPKGLKVTNRTGHILYDSAWIAGVDYDEDEFEDEFNDDDYEPDDSDESDDDDNDNDDNDYDEMDPDEIAALAEHIATQQEEQDPADNQDEEDPTSESEDEDQEDDPNPTTTTTTTTTTTRQCPSDSIWMSVQTP